MHQADEENSPTRETDIQTSSKLEALKGFIPKGFIEVESEHDYLKCLEVTRERYEGILIFFEDGGTAYYDGFKSYYDLKVDWHEETVKMTEAEVIDAILIWHDLKHQ